jgi:hypothetical protein
VFIHDTKKALDIIRMGIHPLHHFSGATGTECFKSNTAYVTRNESESQHQPLYARELASHARHLKHSMAIGAHVFHSELKVRH